MQVKYRVRSQKESYSLVLKRAGIQIQARTIPVHVSEFENNIFPNSSLVAKIQKVGTDTYHFWRTFHSSK